MIIRTSLRLSLFTAGWAIVFGAVAEAQPPQTGPTAAPPAPLIPNAMPVRSCESLTTIELPNTTIESAVVDGTVCRISAVTTHPPLEDRVTIWVAIPMSGWNGRFLGTGGGFSGGSERGVDQSISMGFAAGATDTGHAGASGSFALDSAGRLDW